MKGRHRMTAAERHRLDDAFAADDAAPDTEAPEAPCPADDGDPSRGGLDVRADRLVVRYGPITALDTVSLSVPAGSFTALTGASGAGKSTLLWSLSGVALGSESSGTVHIGGVPITSRADALRLGVVMIPQGNALASVLTAEENCLAPLLALGVDPETARARTAEALTMVGLGESGTHLTEELSGGQQQRVAVARALACRPRVLLADEPTSELDHGNRGVILDLLVELAEQGTTVIMATHDLEAAEVASRSLSIDEGHLIVG